MPFSVTIFFTPCKLVEDLHRDKILRCGTLCSGHQEFPPFLFDKEVIKTLRRGETMWRMKGPVIALSWMDKKAVHAAGTYTRAPAENLP